MMILTTSQQNPSPIEAMQIEKSVSQSNRSVNDAIMDYTAQEVKKNDAHFEQNLAIAAAEINGKGLSLDIRG